MTTLAEAGEVSVLRQLQNLSKHPQPGVAIGIGDDAALLQKVGPATVLSTDMMVEGVDFDLRWASFRDVGHKAAAINLSDMAAMGARPRALLLGIAAPGTTEVAHLMALVRSLNSVGQRYGAPLVGGDLSSIEGPLTVSVTAVGQSAAKEVLRRYRGKPGDIVAVTGRLGNAAAGLRLLCEGESSPKSLVRAQLRPLPRVELGVALAGEGWVSSCADISDGLVRDVRHVLQPGAGVRLRREAIPLARSLRTLARKKNVSPLEWALGGGEDFELVLTVPKKHWAALEQVGAEHDVLITAVGEVTKSPGILLDDDDVSSRFKGFEHFRS